MIAIIQPMKASSVHQGPLTPAASGTRRSCSKKNSERNKSGSSEQKLKLPNKEVSLEALRPGNLLKCVKRYRARSTERKRQRNLLIRWRNPRVSCLIQRLHLSRKILKTPANQKKAVSGMKQSKRFLNQSQSPSRVHPNGLAAPLNSRVATTV